VQEFRKHLANRRALICDTTAARVCAALCAAILIFDQAKAIAVTPCFNDWKHFCAVLREIATGKDGQPLSSLEAQRRAREVLADCGYSWPGKATDVGAKRLGGTMGPESSTDEATIRQHLKKRLRQLRSLNSEN
jgi:hypothetical protein